MRLIVGGERGCRSVYLELKAVHSDHVTEHDIFIIGIDLCTFEVFPEVGD